jgi:hypothetical protein
MLKSLSDVRRRSSFTGHAGHAQLVLVFGPAGSRLEEARLAESLSDTNATGLAQLEGQAQASDSESQSMRWARARGSGQRRGTRLSDERAGRRDLGHVHGDDGNAEREPGARVDHVLEPARATRTLSWGSCHSEVPQ